MSEPMHIAQTEHLSTTTSLAERLAAMSDGPVKRAMQSALALHPAAFSVTCRYRPDRPGLAVEVELPDQAAPVTLLVGADGWLSEGSDADGPEITQAQHLAAIEAAAQAVEHDGSVSSSTRALLLALAAHATTELRAQAQDGDRWKTLAAS